MVLSPGSAFPRACTPLTPAASAPAHAAGVSAGAGPAALPISRNNVPYSGPAAPPTVDTRVMPASFSRAPTLVGRPVELGHHRLHAAVHVHAVVGVADRRVELRELVAALRDRRREGAQPGAHLARGDGVVHAPHRRPGVFTGASQSAVRSSSSRSSVIEQPAMSSEVM